MLNCNCGDPDMTTAKEEYESIFKDYDIKALKQNIKELQDRLDKIETPNCIPCDCYRYQKTCLYNFWVICYSCAPCDNKCPYYPKVTYNYTVREDNTWTPPFII
jgi:hypothetical protein